MRMEGKVAIVTGASRGIGRAIAIALAQEGVNLVINYTNNAEAAEETLKAVEAAGGKGIVVQADVTKPVDAEKLVKAAINNYNKLDILVNNAGITRDNIAIRLTENDWQAVLDTNLTGAFNCAKAAIRPFIRQRQGGRIINMASIIGLMGGVGQANYAAAKAGLIGLTKSLARELASRQITVNAVAPGYIDTAMTAVLSDELKETITKQIPLGRRGKPEDVAQLVLFLASDRAAYITGQVIAVDGGLAM